MKLVLDFLKGFAHDVAPYAGVWIETSDIVCCAALPRVAPYAGVWIETVRTKAIGKAVGVAPYAGVWIETGVRRMLMVGPSSTLCGCVD